MTDAHILTLAFPLALPLALILTLAHILTLALPLALILTLALPPALILTHPYDLPLTSLASFQRDFSDGGASEQPKVPTRILGPSNHPLDCVVQQTDLPEICIGDWLIFRHIGAYTAAFDDSGPPTVYVTQ